MVTPRLAGSEKVVVANQRLAHSSAVERSAKKRSARKRRVEVEGRGMQAEGPGTEVEKGGTQVEWIPRASTSFHIIADFFVL